MSLFYSFGWHHYCLLVIGVICCATDLRYGKIFNAVTYPAIVAGLMLNWLVYDRLVLVLIGFAIGFVPFALASMRGHLGGGDAKLFGAVGAIGGFPYILHFLFATFLLASLYGLLALIWRKQPWLVLRSLIWRLSSGGPGEKKSGPARNPGPRIPMGVFSLIGIALTVWYL